MYDVRAEAREFVADSEKEAVAKAAEFFEIEASELTVKVPDQQEIYGLVSRVVVVAFPQSAPPPSRSGGEREERPERSDRGERGGRDRGGRDGRRGGGRERGGRPERGERAERGDRGERGARGGGGEREAAPRREEAPVAAAEEAIADSKGKPVGDLGEVGQFLLGTIERMQVGSFELEENAEDDFLVLEIRGAAAEALGSGDGRGIDALQLLANQVSMRISDDAPRIVVDAEGNSEKREAFLSRLAERAARRAEDSSRSVALDPMNAHDRRLVHVALRDMEGIATMSIGSGRYRQVVVVPEGSPEYEDARKSSEEAATRERD